MILDESRTPDRKWLSLPLFVDAKQSYESQFIYNIEGTAYIKLVVGPDGSLWLWKVTRPWGMTICLPIYPILGVLAGAFVAAVLAFFRSRREKHQVIKQTG
jgi:hypothetical protein